MNLENVASWLQLTRRLITQDAVWCKRKTQYRQCTYNVTLTCVRATIIAVEKQWVSHSLSVCVCVCVCVCICSRRYPARNAHGPYCHLWPSPLYNSFPHFLINGKILEKKKVTEHKICVLIFSTTFVWSLSLSKKKWARYDNKCIGIHVKNPSFLSEFNETWIFPKDFRKILKYQISWKSVQWEPSCSMRTNRKTADMRKLIVAFRNFANRA